MIGLPGRRRPRLFHMLSHRIDQVHLIAAVSEPAGIDSRTSAGIDNRGGTGRQMPQNQFLRTGPLQAKPAAIEPGGFVLIAIITVAIITNDVAAEIVVPVLHRNQGQRNQGQILHPLQARGAYKLRAQRSEP